MHKAGQRSRAELERCRSVLRNLVKASNYGIIFTSSATESNNLAIRSIITDYITASGKLNATVITTPMEHPSVYETLKSLPAVRVHMLSVSPLGLLDLDELNDALKDETVAMVCVTMANSEIGTIQDVASIAQACRAAYVHCHLDMTQVFGRYNVSLNQLRADTVTMSAHKFHGPKGVGALFYTLTRPPPTPCTTGGKQEQGLRGGTENVPGVAGMALALQLCSDGLTRDGAAERMTRLLQGIKVGIQGIVPDVVFRGGVPDVDGYHGLYQTVSVVLPARASQLAAELSNLNVFVGVGGCACSKGQHSMTLEAIGASQEEMWRTMRISIGFMNTDRDVGRFLKCMRVAMARLENVVLTSS
ncbi:Cysteine desulfurase [Tetrabaena socialis]|uniref:Cysteine desulfurase n=1 Tax=Tetrabaena socialis TaxID=47790 RepID=A0A2J7ZJD8_9CHLO|nr:Cysteine desulfurase [Tetrabaena socialis]|eukprot:PNH00385.1 Cysteine desulfurase [Tetrabaena socialis]